MCITYLCPIRSVVTSILIVSRLVSTPYCKSGHPTWLSYPASHMRLIWIHTQPTTIALAVVCTLHSCSPSILEVSFVFRFIPFIVHSTRLNSSRSIPIISIALTVIHTLLSCSPCILEVSFMFRFIAHSTRLGSSGSTPTSIALTVRILLSCSPGVLEGSVIFRSGDTGAACNVVQ